MSSTDLANFAVVVVASYLFGAIPTGYLTVRLMRGVDIRDYGSGSTGATNVLRTLGRGPFLAVMIADALKGYIPAMSAWLIFGSYDLQVAAGIAAVIGHDFPIYIGFHGGRGVATSFGVYAAMALPLFVGLGGSWHLHRSCAAIHVGDVDHYRAAWRRRFHSAGGPRRGRIHVHESDIRHLRDGVRLAHALA